ncbi:malate:quinone oxidoreductase, partial [Pseudolysinimonas sp.]
LEKCFPDRIEGWRPQLTEMVPSYGGPLSDDAATAKASLARTAQVLQIRP